MAKITVRDIFKDFHTFRGDVYAVEQDGGCKVFERRSEGGGKLLQSFGAHVFGWVKVEEEKLDTAGYTPPAQALDKYTQQALDKQDPAARPTIRMDGPIKFPEGTEFHENGTVTVPPVSHDDDDIPDFQVGLSDAGRAAVEEIKKERSDQKDTPRRVRPSRSKAAIAAREAATMAAAEEEGLLPPKMTKDNPNIVIEPKAEDAPPPSLDDLKARGLLKPASDIANNLADSVMQDEKPDPYCGSCKGRGVIKDPESDDPLDTITCPDC